MVKAPPAPKASSGLSFTNVIAIGLVLMVAAALFAYVRDSSDQPPGDSGGLHTIMLQAVYGEITEEGVDEESGKPLKYLRPFRQERFMEYKYWINNQEFPAELADNMTDEPGMYTLEFMAEVGTTIRFEVTQDSDEWLMCAIKQDDLTIALSITELAGVCVVEHIVLGTVWPAA